MPISPSKTAFPLASLWIHQTIPLALSWFRRYQLFWEFNHPCTHFYLFRPLRSTLCTSFAAHFSHHLSYYLYCISPSFILSFSSNFSSYLVIFTNGQIFALSVEFRLLLSLRSLLAFYASTSLVSSTISVSPLLATRNSVFRSSSPF